MRRRRSSPLVVAVCLLLSLGLHAGLVAALARWWRPEPRQPAPRDHVTVVELQDTPPPDDPPDEKTAPPPPQKPPEPEPPRPQPDVEMEELLEPEPEPEPEDARKPDFELSALKMVEQPDELDEPDSPQDVDFLSNINNDAPENTQAEVTNLEQDAVVPEAAQLEPSAQEDVGTADEDVIAQDRTQTSREERQAPPQDVSAQEQRPEQDDPAPQSLLAMRDLEPRDHARAQEEHQAQVDVAAEGSLQRDQEQQSSVAPQDRRARIDRRDPAYKFKLSQDQLEAIVGKDQTARADIESLQASKKVGVWEKQRARYQSPLENFVPEVRAGNQTALRSRKHPFARYIAQMHRKIHEAWAWGFLDQLDGRAPNHPLNNRDLWTRVEIVLNANGTIDKVITIRHSGKTAFDAAAREIVFAAGPYPNPPSEIRSPNGKIYMHWAFHRDDRACGTFGASPFILDGRGGGDRPDPNRVVQTGRESLRRLQRKPRARGPEGPAPPAVPRAEGGHDHDHGYDHASEESRGSSSSGAPPSLGADPEALAADPNAMKHANAWLAYVHKGAVDRVVAKSTLPFRFGDAVVARTREELVEVIRAMVEEARGKKPKRPRVYTAAGLRKAFGSVPAGVSEGQGRVYALTRVGGDFLIVVLEKKFGAFKVVGIAR